MRPIDADALKSEMLSHAPIIVGDFYKILALVDNTPTINSLGSWISCSERLPEEDGRFLVFLPDRNGTFMCADFLNGKWYQDDYECTSNHVIAWLPLPNPYEVKNNDK